MKNKKRQYIIRKYIMASSIDEALKIERTIKADECWIDPEWQKQNPEIGYNYKNK